MSPEISVVGPAEYAATAARLLANEIRRALESRERCSLALSGGSTPRPVYQLLATELPERALWARIDVFFADERCVPPDDPASNYRVAKEALLDRVPIAPSQVHRMEGERHDRDQAARLYEGLLPGRLDLLLLGLGADGHTASLFPEAPALAETSRRVLAVTGPQPPVERLTITPLVISAARRTATLVAGPDKAAVLARVFDDTYPSSRIPGRLARDGLWIVDTAAAAGLAVRR